jgi:transcriptional regulator with XRE-family HTH domain
VLSKDKEAKKLAKRLRQLRESKGFSQEDLAFESRLGRSYYWRVEQGRINVTLETLVRLSNTLGVELVELFQKQPLKKGR